MKIKVFINVDWFAISHFSIYLANLVKTANLVKVYALDTGFGKKISNLGAEFHPIKLSRENSGIFSELKSILEIYMDLRKENTDIIECFTIKPSL